MGDSALIPETAGCIGGGLWPGELPPALAAALDNPGKGSIVFDEHLRVLHATSALSAVLDMNSNLRPGSGVLEWIRKSGCINDRSLAALEADLIRAVAHPNTLDSRFDIAGAAPPQMFTVETRRIGTGCWIATFEDITATRDAESRLLNLALTDPLTTLGNRVSFEKQVTAALGMCDDQSTPEKSAVLLVDLDRFKAVNDTLGHPTGDALLKLVAERLRCEVAQLGIAARLGGDEFAVLVSPGTRPAELAGLAARIIELLQRTFLVHGNVVNVGASIGIAVAPTDGNSMDRLLKSADLALYQAKSSGRGRFCFFDKGMEDRAQARRNLELELRKALPLRQMEVHYRPQIDTASGELQGFKAALHWRHPKRGMMRSEEFAPLAEELGLTVQINDWLLRKACRQAAHWPENVRLTFTSSWAQFESLGLAETVTRALEAAKLEANRLEVEVTEGILLRNEQQVFATLHDLRALGVRVAMGDFGTGYASLSQLASFPFDRVRISRALLVDGESNARHRAIVRAIAALGASLGISTLGDDIGTAAELARIHSSGCPAVQGCLPGDDLPSAEADKLVAATVKAHHRDRASEGALRLLTEQMMEGKITHEQPNLQTCVLQS
jgi:diguanylate cyclase (GGDEF)-like protein